MLSKDTHKIQLIKPSKIISILLNLWAISTGATLCELPIGRKPKTMCAFTLHFLLA